MLTLFFYNFQILKEETKKRRVIYVKIKITQYAWNNEYWNI